MPADSHKPIWPISLMQIEETVSAHLGPGRVPGNASGPCLSRQVSMYLAKHVGGHSLSKIGRFYNGRHHTTVLHAIAKIERVRKTDEAFDSFLSTSLPTPSPLNRTRSGHQRAFRWRMLNLSTPSPCASSSI
jgi:hypothetical protein